MVKNANDSAHRLQTIFYLCSIRYDIDAQTAGIKFQKEEKTNELCRNTIVEMRNEIAEPSVNLQMGTMCSEAEIRKYLSEIIHAFDLVAAE